MFKLAQVLSIALVAVVLTGCQPTAITYSKITSDRFSLDIPSSLKEFAISEQSNAVKYFSDKDDATFNEGAITVYLYEGYVEEDQQLDQEYCDDTYELLEQSAGIEFNGLEKKEVKFVTEANGKPAHCDITYALKNKDTSNYVESQLQRQYLFIDGSDELVIEIATIQPEFPEFLTKSLDSFTVIPAAN